MLDKLKYFAKLSSAAVFSCIKILCLIFVSTTISFIISVIALMNAGDQANVVAPHAGGKAGLLGLIIAFPVHCLLIFLIFCSAFIMITLGYKYVIQKIIHIIIKDKAESLLSPIIDRVMAKFRASGSGRIKSIHDYTAEKLQMIQALKNESGNIWVRKVLEYGFRKIRINDTDLKENVDIYEIIKIKAIEALKDATEPDKKFIFMLAFLQLIFAAITCFI